MQPSHKRFFSLSPSSVAGLVWVGLALAGAPAWAQTAAPASIPLAKASTADQKPLWKELTPAQQVALQPLSSHWNDISVGQKRKWLALSLNFAKMSPDEQTKLHERMLDWGSLSPTQRSQARLNFAETKRLAPTEKQAKWEAYQTLDPEEKQKLAKNVRNKLPGAATAVKLVPQQKLAIVPTARKDEPKGPSIATAPHQINPKTLLPLPVQRMDAARPQASNPPATNAP